MIIIIVNLMQMILNVCRRVLLPPSVRNLVLLHHLHTDALRQQVTRTGLMMRWQVRMQVVQVRNRMANHVGCTDQALAGHHDAAVQQDRVLVHQMRWLLLDRRVYRLYPASTRHLHVRLVLLVRVKGRLADHTLVRGTAVERDGPRMIKTRSV